jgi:peptidyl-prolyl cis-trans isomerase SurA
MRSSTLLLILLLSLSQLLIAQKNSVVTIDGRPISKEEFEVIYQKNNTNLNDDNEVKSPQEYMQMFIDFKLKVIEAENRGLDTTEAFKTELKGYRDELAKTYLTDVSVTDSMVKEAYYRSTHLIKASHILIELSDKSTPEDTLKAYNKLIEIRNMYLNKEKSFEELAKEFSEDPSAITEGGKLPCFGAFRMLTAFENGAYATPVGEVSMPVRTSVGFHLIKVDEIIPSLGEMKVGHIMKKFSTNVDIPESEDKAVHAFIDSLYQLVLNGADWAELAKEYSDDKLAAQNGGIMRFISQEFSVPEFADAAFALKTDGEVAKPVRTKYGWHLIKRIETKPPQTFEEAKGELTKKVKADPTRSNYSKLRFINNMKAEYGYTQYDENIKSFQKRTEAECPDTLYTLPQQIGSLVLLKFGGKDYDVAHYFESTMEKYKLPYILKNIFINGLDQYFEEIITAHENSRLEIKYPEFSYLIREYHDGILLFSIMETEVWNKAIQDSLGLLNYYNQHKDKYTFGEHFDGLLIKCDSEETRKVIEKAIADGNTDAESLQALAINIGGNKNSVVKGRWEKGANRYIDYFAFKGEKSRDIKEDTQFVVGSIKNGGTKTLDEARGLFISDYQSIIEDEWLKELHGKYKIVINEKLLRKVKSLKK